MDLAGIGSIAGGLLGGFGARKSRKLQEKMYWQNRWDNLPEGIRANAEAAGVNPLLLLGPGVGNGAGYQPTMGHELSTAGQVVTDASLALENQKIRRAELELENKRLEELVKANTLRPTTPGVYGDRNVATRQNTGDPVQSRPSGVDNDGPTVAGVDVRKNSAFSDAEDVETRYGDVASSLYGFGTIIADGIETAADTRYGKWRMGVHDYLTDFYRGKSKRPKSNPPKANTKTKEYRDHMRSAYPTVYD